MDVAATTTLPSGGFYGSYTRLGQEFSSLATAAVAWDQTFENAMGTYPTREFVDGYRAFTERAHRVIEHGQSLPHANAYELERLCDSTLTSDYIRATSTVLPQLERMASSRTPFRTGGFMSVEWSSILDPLINDLRRGERLVQAKLLTMEPSIPATPNPGVPGGTPTYPGGPRPTPIP